MNDTEKRSRRACFTGHRPEKLTRDEESIRADIEKEIRRAMEDGLNVFITGMAKGVDIWAAQIVLKLRREGCDIRLLCACPFPDMEKNWGTEWKRQYRQVLTEADRVEYIGKGYTPSCFQVRNQWMVDHASRVIAVFNGERSGTKNTVDYAARVGVPVVFIEG